MKKDFEVGERVTVGLISHRKFLYKCPKCHNHTFRVKLDGDLLVCDKCKTVCRKLSEKNSKKKENTKKDKTEKEKTEKESTKSPKELVKELKAKKEGK